MNLGIRADYLPDADSVLGAHTRSLSRAFRERLSHAYADPAAAFDRFREEARRGVTEAAVRMRDEPHAFGSLLEGAEDAAREAAILGARAYEARIAEQVPRLAAAVLEKAVTASAEAAGADPVRLRETWQALGDAYGFEHAAELIAEWPRSLFPAADIERARETAALMLAITEFRRRAGGAPPEPLPPLPPLPRSLSEERNAAEALPEPLQGRLVAAADGMRQRLARAYDLPLAVEARLHLAVSTGGVDALGVLDREPTLLGALRSDHPGGAGAAHGAAQAAIGYARIAYEYHTARLPERAADLAARDQVASVLRQARDPDRAMDSIHEAIQLQGPALERHLSQARERSRSTGHGRGPDGHGSAPGAERGGAPPSEPGGGATGDPAVQEAVRAHAAAEEVDGLNRSAAQLRSERTEAERQLAHLMEQDRELSHARRDFLAAARDVYQEPDAALPRWEELVARERGHLERARERLLEQPSRLGALRSELRTGVLGRLGFRSASSAREAVPGVASQAVRVTRARRVIEDPVSWTTPDGERIEGRERVRAAAAGIARDRQDRISRAEERVKELGGTRKSRDTAQRALADLSPEQRGAAAKIGGSTISRSLQLAGAAVRRAIDAGRVARVLGEGPAGP